MRIISKSKLVEYFTKVPQAKTALEEWYEKTKRLKGIVSQTLKKLLIVWIQ